MDLIEYTTRLLLCAPSSYLEELLSQWLQWAPGDGRGSTGYATKESLIAALRQANLGALAKKCKSYLLDQAHTCKTLTMSQSPGQLATKILHEPFDNVV